MNLPSQEILSIIDEMKILANEKQLIEKKEEKLQAKIIKAFADTLNQVYKNWRPAKGEKVIIVNLREYPPYINEMFVVDVDGYKCRMANRPDEKYNFAALWLNDDVHDFEVPILTFP
ncbi:hypothetical protein QUF70_12515, partial [Desulfobacterales bacterium HSG17]|nr:hypothetical protein [Desulfobacterales bacterium HSG17]